MKLILGAAAILGMGAGADPAPVPCNPIGGGKHECSWWRAGDGRGSGAIVVHGGNVVGRLHQGRNWITCQQAGAKVHNEAGNRNRWYGWTLSDYGGWGWASALDAKGGADYGAFAGVPDCNGKHGAAPGVAGLWSTRPPGGAGAPSPPPPSGGNPTCPRKPRTVKAKTARFTAHVYGAYRATQGGKRLRRIERLNERFTIGSVRIKSTVCKIDGKWIPYPEPKVEVSSKALGRKGDDKFKAAGGHGLGRGWGVMVGEYRDNGVPLITIKVVQCLPNAKKHWRGWVELAGLGTSLLKLSPPATALVTVGSYAATRWTPKGDVDCVKLNEHTFRIDASSKRLKLSHVNGVGGSVAARFGPGSGSGREVLMADIEPSPS